MLESVISLPTVFLCIQSHNRGHKELVDDGGDEEEEEHARGSDPSGPLGRVPGVVGDGQRRNEEWRDDVAVGGAEQAHVGSHAVVAVVQTVLAWLE